MTKMQSDAHMHDDHVHHTHDGHDCRHAEDHRRHAAEALARAERICRERGLRLTPIRRQALEALHADHRPVGAYDLADRISPAGGRRLAPISIYRALDFLVENGFAHRIERLGAYVGCVRGGEEHSAAFVVCRACRLVAETHLPRNMRRLIGEAAAGGFAVETIVVEAEGLCASCRAADA